MVLHTVLIAETSVENDNHENRTWVKKVTGKNNEK